MKPFIGAFIKFCEIGLLYPLHRISRHQHVHNMKFKPTVKAITQKGVSAMYKGVGFQIAQNCINRYTDVHIYNTCGYTQESANLSCLFKALTYPLQTLEVYYQLNNKIINNIHQLYKGIWPYIICNIISYSLWLQIYNKYTSTFGTNKLHTFTGGFMSGIAVDVCTNPLKVIKTNLQNQTLSSIKSRPYFYRGFSIRIILCGIQSALFTLCI